MNKDEETYLFLSQSIDILNDSLNILIELKINNISPILFNAAFRYALVEYSKPFGATNGLLKNNKEKPIRIKYDVERFISQENLELHKKIIDSRNQFHAHGDMTVFESKLYVQNCDQEEKVVTITKNNVHGCQLFSEVDLIVEMINKILDAMDKELAILKTNLTPNCTF